MWTYVNLHLLPTSLSCADIYLMHPKTGLTQNQIEFEKFNITLGVHNRPS